MDWKEVMFPIIVEHLAPILVTVLGAIATVVATKVATVLKERLNVDIDMKLNHMLHEAIARSVEALVRKGFSHDEVVARTAVYLKENNPDALSRFGLDTDYHRLANLIGKTAETNM